MADGGYLICFDFPEVDEPLFAGWLADGALGFAPTMKTAARFETFDAAERSLKNSYGRATSEWGAVVETWS